MVKYALSSLLLVGAIASSSAFSSSGCFPKTTRSLHQSPRLNLSSPPSADIEMFSEAVNLAEKQSIGGVDVENLDKLASALEQSAQCVFEDPAEPLLCEKEIQDRIDVAEILRLKIELQLRIDYLKKGNLFADDVHKEEKAEERRRFRAELIANRDKAKDGPGSDLGLW
mmetsp:Transcript_52230/g.62907  ORF Transcript_52230/g.62907 Transcript_52230/m.62907 type:complete len:169 (-) Transcript_52230:296-802(-)|eukprot:CAMPEP_0172507692 /NCGR_PEP_ID=MMETSP1066-20121228/205702_1 /TAXON_ID=671091 /ORGANISM="Coscinodiscus wailesii, Strain CCMP2513" /LENGTH=168 /DNA_ID=CAMNT_0013285335 /DNA_START=125 /DNA_END=631 /DNA_ORIENTATION=+